MENSFKGISYLNTLRRLRSKVRISSHDTISSPLSSSVACVQGILDNICNLHVSPASLEYHQDSGFPFRFRAGIRSQSPNGNIVCFLTSHHLSPLINMPRMAAKSIKLKL